MSQGYKSILHIHTIQQQCDLKEIDIEFIEDEKGNKLQKVKPKFVSSGATIHAKIAIEKAICIEKHETLSSMGRFTLRDEGKTIAVGKILKYKPAQIKVDDEDNLTEEQKQQIDAARKKIAELQEKAKAEAAKKKLAEQLGKTN